jgi:hypothetical protein
LSLCDDGNGASDAEKKLQRSFLSLQNATN